MAGAPAVNAAAVKASRLGQMFFANLILPSLWNFWMLWNKRPVLSGRPRFLLFCDRCLVRPVRKRAIRAGKAGRPVGRPHQQASELLAWVPLTLLELFHDL